MYDDLSNDSPSTIQTCTTLEGTDFDYPHASSRVSDVRNFNFN